ncbi:MAG: nicotinate (nicotinamide) nucleotide adenylyltransferase [Clostridia bacterium]|nr:nicotinate (nicotinamide) nucleotide adenylyltransferase [Clostridia bacterium]
MKGKIGIFGGTFDPVHKGHLAMAECAGNQAELDMVIFLPNGNPPHKKQGGYADGIHRFNMLKLATQHEPRFQVSDYELDGQRHYTFHTMEHFKDVYPDSEIMFIIGADSLDYLHSWYRGEELIRNNTFIVVNRHFREGYNFYDNIAAIENMGGKLIVADMPCIDVSSTQIRSGISAGITDLPLDSKVYDYIRLNKLYCKE